jgi:hypothetical protein
MRKRVRNRSSRERLENNQFYEAGIEQWVVVL